MFKQCLAMLYVITLSTANVALANDVTILSADFNRSADNLWSIRVTLKHADTGWDHYADSWRVIDNDGSVLGKRVLHHPHVDEQPFTRSLDRVQIADDSGILYVEAHDKLHGWTKQRLTIDFDKMRDGHLRVEAR